MKQPIDPELCKATWAVVQEARISIQAHETEGLSLAVDRRPPKIDFFKTGFPQVTSDFSAEPINYRNSFVYWAGGEENLPSARDLPSYPHLVALIEGHERLLQSFLVKEPPSTKDRFRHFFDYDVWLIPGSILDRVLHLHGQDFSYEQFLQVYCEIEAGLLWDELPFAIAIPVALTAFDDDAPMQLASDVGLVKMSDALQLARVKTLGSPTASANEIVVGAATHAAIFTGWKMPNYSGYGFKPYEKLGWFPTSGIDSFFDALRVVTGLDTGYAQIFMLPSSDWAFPPFDGTLPPVILGPEVRRYPLHFDDFGWLRYRQSVTRKQLEEVGEIYQAISKKKSLQLGATRLSAAMLREAEDNKILDLLIGLEASLGDAGRSEMTHKLALRTAAVLAHVHGNDPEAVFKNVKHLYDYRSAVAHGDSERAAKRREIETSEGIAFSSEVATEYLRTVIRALSQSDIIQTGRDVDFELILSSLKKSQETSYFLPHEEDLESTES